MLLKSIFDQFCQESPLTVMARATVEYALAPAFVNELFERTAQVQYTRELTLSALVDLMVPVVCGTHQSARSAYLKSSEEVGASLSAVYEKLSGIEPAVCEALVRELAVRLGEVIDRMKGGREPLLAGYQVRILDGNCLAASQKRIGELRDLAAGPLPGKSLVVLDPERMLAVDLFAIEDGHAQERSALDRVLARVGAKQLWIADRNFCTGGFLQGNAQRGGSFVIRLHRGLAYQTQGPWREIGMSETGYVMERTVRIEDHEGQWLLLRLVRVSLQTKTRDGDEELLLLTNLPEADADAIRVAHLYRQRWLLETAFLHLTQTLRCEINSLGYPAAALFGFAVALLSYNLLATVRAALRAKYGQVKGDEEVSLYHLTDDIVGPYRGMAIVLPASFWKKKYRRIRAEELAQELLALAGSINFRRIQKAKRGPKKPPTPKTRAKGKPHVSTHRLLKARKTK